MAAKNFWQLNSKPKNFWISRFWPKPAAVRFLAEAKIFCHLNGALVDEIVDLVRKIKGDIRSG